MGINGDSQLFYQNNALVGILSNPFRLFNKFWWKVDNERACGQCRRIMGFQWLDREMYGGILKAICSEVR